MPALGLRERPGDLAGLQVAAAVGQGRLMGLYTEEFAKRGLVAGQVLLTRGILADRTPYLNARMALRGMLERGIVPVVNENDTVGVEELRVGDNDRLSALVSHLVAADLLILLTDTPGLYSDDPSKPEAELMDEISSDDPRLDSIARLPGGRLGSGGVSSKVAAARMAAFSGIPTVVASSSGPEVVEQICLGEPTGTWVNPNARKLSARKLWIAFGLETRGRVMVDRGAEDAITGLKKSLLPVGVRQITGDFAAREAVEVVNPEGRVIAKGVSRMTAAECLELQRSNKPTIELINRDDLVVLVG
jgi:glutamate 5-kinase